MASNTASNLSLRSILEKDKLNGTNFLDWYRNLRIVLKQERKEHVLDHPVPDEPAANAPKAQKDAYSKHVNESVDVTCLMLGSMESELQKQLMEMEAYTIIGHLKKMFQEKARIERFATIKALLSYKLTNGSSVSPHVLKMKGHLDHLQKLGLEITQELAIDIILQSLPDAFDVFIMNYNMHNMKKTVYELHGMLKTAEQNIKNTKDVLMVNKGKGMKRKGKGKRKVKVAKDFQKPKPKPQPKAKPPKEGACHFCNELGHWKRNCKLYLEDLKKKVMVHPLQVFML